MRAGRSRGAASRRDSRVKPRTDAGCVLRAAYEGQSRSCRTAAGAGTMGAHRAIVHGGAAACRRTLVLPKDANAPAQAPASLAHSDASRWTLRPAATATGASPPCRCPPPPPLGCGPEPLIFFFPCALKNNRDIPPGLRTTRLPTETIWPGRRTPLRTPKPAAPRILGARETVCRCEFRLPHGPHLGSSLNSDTAEAVQRMPDCKTLAADADMAQPSRSRKRPSILPPGGAPPGRMPSISSFIATFPGIPARLCNPAAVLA